MFSYVQFGILLLQVARAFLERADDRQNFEHGQDAEIAKHSLAILKKTDAGKKLMEKIDAMDAGKLGGLLSDLERP